MVLDIYLVLLFCSLICNFLLAYLLYSAMKENYYLRFEKEEIKKKILQRMKDKKELDYGA